MRYLISMAAVLALAASAQASALGALARVSVVDRESGATLPTYYSRGEYWVAGEPGGRYAIEIRNCAPGRLLAVTSVDGVNVLSGDTAGFEQGGYVFDPGQSYQISGWRKSNSQVAAFTFTDSRDSYAARTGRPVNVGIIGVAVFREQPPRAVYTPPPEPPVAPVPFSGQAGSRADEAEAMNAPASARERAPVAAASAAPAPRLGTGHGEREYSYVVDTEFHRSQAEPNEVIRIRYDSFENLVAMGIIRKSRPAPRAPDAFPGSEQRHFVPDPG